MADGLPWLTSEWGGTTHLPCILLLPVSLSLCIFIPYLLRANLCHPLRLFYHLHSPVSLSPTSRSFAYACPVCAHSQECTNPICAFSWQTPPQQQNVLHPVKPGSFDTSVLFFSFAGECLHSLFTRKLYAPNPVWGSIFGL